MGADVTEKELAELLRNNPDVRIEGDLIAAVDTRHQSSTNAAMPFVSRLSEHDLQAAVIAECDQRSVLRAEYALIFAIPNGGQRHPAVAAKLKAEGVRAGVPDLFLPVARPGYHGLFIELKCGGHKPSEAQLAWIRNLRAEGYKCEVVWDSVDEVIGLIESYLESGKVAKHRSKTT